MMTTPRLSTTRALSLLLILALMSPTWAAAQVPPELIDREY